MGVRKNVILEISGVVRIDGLILYWIDDCILGLIIYMFLIVLRIKYYFFF